MSKRELVCIGCPMGCALEVYMEGNEVIKVSGNTCKRGEEYGRKECTNPTRIVTSSVVVEGGDIDVVPVKTEHDIPKDRIFEIVKELKKIVIKAPVNVGDIVAKDIVKTGVNVIATQKIEKKVLF